MLARPAHGCGLLLCLLKTAADELAVIFIREDGSDGCRVVFMPWEKQSVQVGVCWMELGEGV